MNSFENIMKELEAMGTAQTRKIWTNHGAKGDFFGVKIGDMKTIVKRVKKDYALSKALFKTGNVDAQYLAGLIGDETKMTKKDLNDWAKLANWYMISEFALPFVAAESEHGYALALEWIDNKNEHIASAGWATLSLFISINDDVKIDLKHIEKLMNRVGKEIHNEQNRVRYTMNSFIISVGGYILPLRDKAKHIANQIGQVDVFVGNTSCRVPLAIAYIAKMELRPIKKRKNARC